MATDVEAVGVKTFSVTFVDGTYTYLCDLHPVQMKGTFTVGTRRRQPAASHHRGHATTSSCSRSPRRRSRSRRRPERAVKALKTGRAAITVRDRSATRGVKLSGAGVSRTTGVKFVGTATWNVKLAKGTLVYASDARKPVLRGGRVPVS